jgi:hypothetical protein
LARKEKKGRKEEKEYPEAVDVVFGGKIAHRRGKRTTKEGLRFVFFRKRNSPSKKIWYGTVHVVGTRI